MESVQDKNRVEAWLQRAERPLAVCVALLAAGLILLFVAAALRRLHDPFPLEQLEGAMAVAVARVAQGLPLYARPDFSFIPYMYSPAYFWASAWMACALGVAGHCLIALRMVSILSTLGCFAAIFALVRMETRSAWAALAGAGLYAAAYPVTLHWFDLGRVDSFYVFLVLLALLATRRLHPALAAPVWVLAMLAKQTIAPVAVLVLLQDWKRPRRALTGLGVFLTGALGSTVWLNHTTHGWYTYYIFTVPGANSDLRLHAAAFFLSTALLAPFGIAIAVVAAALLLPGLHWNHSIARFYWLSGGALLALSWFLSAHAGATVNTSMPLYALLAVAFGIALARLLAWLRAQSSPAAQAGVLVVLLAVCIQLGGEYSSPKLAAPLPPVRASQQQLIDWLRQFSGDVYLPAHPYEATLAGKSALAEEAALHDALRPGREQVNAPLLKQIHHAVDTEAFAAILLDRPPDQEMSAAPWMPGDWRLHYPMVGFVPGSEVVNPFSPRPRYVLFSCRALASPAAQAVVFLDTGASSPCSTPRHP
jgi:hypothetical protein